MKKLFLTLALVATSVVAWADRWTAPSSQTYPDETPLYVTVTVDEQAATHVPRVQEIAAFIDNECRAQALEPADNGVYVLRVRGNATADANKTITIKGLYNGLVYTLSTSEKFDGEAQTHSVPLALTLQPLLSISLDEDPIEMTIGGSTYNLANHLVYHYGTDGMPTSASPIDEIETPLTVTYKWDPKSEEGYINVSAEGVITAVAQTNGAYTAAMVTVEGPADETGYSPYFETRATVNVNLPAAEQIVVTPTELTVYVGEYLYGLIREGRLSISILPSNADQSYSWSTNEERFPWNGNYYFDAAGDYHVEAYSTSNRDVTPVTVTFHVREPLTLTLDASAYAEGIGMIQPKSFNVYLNTNEGFDPTLLTIESYHKTPIAPFTYEVGSLQKEPDNVGAAPGRYYVTVTLTGRYLGAISYDVLYNGNTITADGSIEDMVYPEVSINTGWQWVSPYAFDRLSEVGSFYNNDNNQYQSWVTDGIIEMRTQEGLLYVDPNLGAFGDITSFDFANGMYKVKASAANILRLGSGQNNWSLAQYNDGTSISHGYNWVVYPYEYALTMDEASNSLVDYAHEGDQIISKDGSFAEFSNGAWVHSGFTFQPGAGYMYYYTGTEDIFFEMDFDIYDTTPACYADAAPVKGEMGSMNKMEPVWTVDHSRFADNMTVVAEIEGLMNAEDWVLGAFVGDECRGEGRSVCDGIMFIGIAGKSGERMNFRLHNTRTGAEFDVTESLLFQQKVGSLKAPLHLSSEGATGIENVNVKENLNDKAIYDLSGRRVVKPVKGIYVVGGRKVAY